jgi:ABC-type uncharacterized transport system permease subunit
MQPLCSDRICSVTIFLTIAFYAAFACYLLAFAAVLRYLAKAELPALALAQWTAMAGAVLLAVAFLARWIEWGQFPVSGTIGPVLMLVMLTTMVALPVVLTASVRALLCFYVPAMTLLYSLAVAIRVSRGETFLEKPPSDALNEAFLTVHVGLAFFSYALFLVASLTSVAYLFQARHLKQHQLTNLFHRLPSLEHLDRTLLRLIAVGYGLFSMTLVLGFIWAVRNEELLDERWFVSTKILRAAAMVVFFAIAFHGRQIGWLRGQKLAYFIFVGFTGLMLIYLSLGIANYTNYDFWRASI